MEKITISTLLQRELKRYSDRGLGLIFGIVWGLLLLKFVPPFARFIWPIALNFIAQYEVERWKFIFYFTWLFNCTWYFFINLCFCLIYKLEWKIFERSRVHNEPWPWKVNQKEWRKQLNKTLKVIFLNNFVIIPSLVLMQAQIFGTESTYSFEIEELPDAKTFFLQTTFCMLLEDFLFTLSHRLLHIPFFYKRVHKQHHQYNISIGICAEYAHPIEFVFGNSIPFAIPCLILGRKMHAFTYLLWNVYRVANTVYGHSGYEFDWVFSDLLPFMATARYHDFHHSHNVGNYSGSFIFWDIIFEWNKDYYKHYAKIEQQSKQTKTE
ncbi:sterol desaturase family protein [Stylonychia lemnae]|uniref:Sterol desaturase family protein n=1 Tax=Stylonychia lemnae TaxID=5949 RepID=A0A077ZR65_STYLE|nr:sterol desaturase family protein [Stylonychia lemnae]|eukprot:CDW71830.1 sterol desaturase family protein [Stylonychia lemnae]